MAVVDLFRNLVAAAIRLQKPSAIMRVGELLELAPSFREFRLRTDIFQGLDPKL